MLYLEDNGKIDFSQSFKKLQNLATGQGPVLALFLFKILGKNL